MVVDEIRGFDSKKLVIYNGVRIPNENRLTRPIDTEIKIVYVGRLEREKGIIEALAAVRQLSCPVRFYVAGTGVLEDVLRSEVESEKLENVYLLGNVTNVYELLFDCDIFILPSYYEAISLSILEAMACGLPVLATKVGGIPEAVEENVTGILVPPMNVSFLKQGLEKLVMDVSLRQRMGQAGRKRAKNYFNIEGTLASIRALLKNI